MSRAPRFAPQARPARVNGAAGFVVGPEHKPFAVIGFTVVEGRILEIDLIIDPDKLRGLALQDGIVSRPLTRAPGEV